MPEDLSALRRRLVQALPGRIAGAVDGYEAFAATPPPDDPKGFAAWHAAAKAALAHIDLLVKLARWAEGRTEIPETEGVESLLAEARVALAGFDTEPEAEDAP